MAAAEASEKEALKLFEEVDADQNGSLDVDELKNLAKTMGVELTADQLAKAFAKMDTDVSRANKEGHV